MNYWYGVIYKITNLMNGKIYIGKTTVGNFSLYIENHFKEALKGKSPKKYFYNAIRKYGRNNFKWEILGYCYSEKELNETEMECIYFYRSFGADGNNYDNIYGYNMTMGGDGTKGIKRSEEHIQLLRKIKKNNKNMLNKKHTKETIKLMSESAKGRIVKESTKELLSKINTGNIPTEETCRKLSISLKKAYAEGRRRKRTSADVTDETRKKQSIAATGRKHKPESIEKMRISQKGKIISEQQRLDISNTLKKKAIHNISFKLNFYNYAEKVILFTKKDLKQYFKIKKCIIDDFLKELINNGIIYIYSIQGYHNNEKIFKLIEEF